MEFQPLTYVTQQNIPRSYGVNQMKGCGCGKGIDKYGNYPILPIFSTVFKTAVSNANPFPSTISFLLQPDWTKTEDFIMEKPIRNIW